ncbi:hypothetical protein ABPG74_006598 [Tetrahymena malaccensis]
MNQITDYQNSNKKQQSPTQNLGYCPLHKDQQLVSLKFDNDLENNFLKCLECLYVSGTQNTFSLVKLFGDDQDQVINGWPIIVDDAQIYKMLIEVERKLREKSYLRENQKEACNFFKELRREINNLIDEKEQFIQQKIEEQQDYYEQILLQYDKISQKQELKTALLNNQGQNENLREIISRNIKNQDTYKENMLNLLAKMQQYEINFDNLKKIQMGILNLVGSIGAVANQNKNQGFSEQERKGIFERNSSELQSCQINQNNEDQQISKDKLEAENIANKETDPKYQQLQDNDQILKRKIIQNTEQNSQFEKQNYQLTPCNNDQLNDQKSTQEQKKQQDFEQQKFTSQKIQSEDLRSQLKISTKKSSFLLQIAVTTIIVLVGLIFYSKLEQFQNQNIKIKETLLESNNLNFEEKSQTNIKNGSLTIDLKNRQLSREEINKAFTQLDFCQSIMSLNLFLSKCNIDEQTLQLIAQKLQRCQNIATLNINLSENIIGQEGVAIILNAVKNIININTLNLNLNQNNIGDQGVKNFAEAILSIKTIKSLNVNFSNNQISYEGTVYLTNSLNSIHNLNSLNLDFSNNQIGSKGVFQISLAIQNHLKINSLNLNFSNNQIDDNGVENFTKILSKLQKISSLVVQFGQNQIGDQGLRYFFDTLKSLQKVISLNLNFSGNQISNEGVNYITVKIEQLQNLNHLNMNFSDNNISQQVIKDTKSRLEKSNIKKLLLSFC